MEFCVDISFVESPPRLQSSQNMLKTHFEENNFPPNLSRFEFKFTADIDRKYLGKIEPIHIQWLHHNVLIYLAVANNKGGRQDIPFINNGESHLI